jgi:integrase
METAKKERRKPMADGTPHVYWNATHRVWQSKATVGGKRVTKQVPCDILNERDAQAYIRDWFHSLPKEEAPVVVVRVVHTLRTIGPRWMEWQETVETKSKARHNKDLLDWTGTLNEYVYTQPIAHVDLTTLSRQHAIEWIDWLKRCTSKKTKRRLAPFTVRNIVKLVRRIIVTAQGREWVPNAQNPFEHDYVKQQLKGAETLAGKNTRVALSNKQIRTLLACKRVPPFRRVRYWVAGSTGLRASEMQALSWGDVFLDNGVPRLRVFNQLAKYKDVTERISPKNDRQRWVPLHPKVVKVLAQWKLAYQGYCGFKPTADRPVFPDAKGDWYLADFPKMLRRDLRKAGLPDKFEGHNHVMHGFRRSFMSMLDDEVTPANIRDGIVGHADKSCADKHYIAKHIDKYVPWIERLPL